MDEYGELLLHDGLSQFAVASQVTHDELFIQKYKVIALLSKAPTNYVDFLKSYGLVQTDKLVTAWQTFTRETPSEARRENIDGLDIFDVYERLKK